MSKRKPLSDEERAFFRQTQANTKPLSTKKRVTTQASKKVTVPYKPRVDNEPPSIGWGWQHDYRHQSVSGDETLFFCRGGLQHRLVQQFRRGQMPIDAKLDLHQRTVDRALTETAHFFSLCQSQRKRLVLLVHGKGHFSSDNQPVLKNVLNQWLRDQPMVLAFCSAIPKHGGTGALYVLLKRKDP